MSSSTFSGSQFLIDGMPRYVRGAEVQYFRLRASEWRDRLSQSRDCGMNVVSSYMPWYWHEPVEGQVDVDGRSAPERNLRRFLDLAHELGLFVIARPGPFVNSELRWGGFPLWLFRDHPETMSRRGDGRAGLGRPLPAEGEPVYRRYVRQWYRAVVPLIAEYDRHRGGPVVMFQPDNELSAAWSFGLLNSLYDPAILREAWPQWLERTFGSLDAVSERHAKRYARFADVEPPRAFPDAPADKQLCLDWLNFKRWFFADWGATLAKWAQEDGVQVPIIFNEPVAGFYEHGDHAGFGRVLRERGIRGATCCHTYTDRMMDLDGLTGSAMAVELVRSSPWGGPPLAVEINCSWSVARLSRSAANWPALLRVGHGHGLMGSVVYPFTAADAPLDDTIDGPDYWDAASVTREGDRTEAFHQLARFNRFTASWEDVITAAEPVADLTIAYAPGQRLLDFLGAPPLASEATAPAGPGGERFSAEPALEHAATGPSHDWLDGYEAVSRQTVRPEAGLWKKTREAATTCERLNVAWDLIELTSPNREPGRGWIVVPCTGCLDAEAIAFLVDHMDRGGGCLFFPTVPVATTEGRPDRRAADRLGVVMSSLVRPAGGVPLDYGTRTLDLESGGTMGVNGWIVEHRFAPGSRVLASRAGRPVIARIEGDRAKAIVAGTDLTFTSHASLEFWRWIVEDAMGIAPAVRVEGACYHGLLRRGPRGSVLTVLNPTGETRTASVEVGPGEGTGAGLRFPIALAPCEARCLVMGVDLAGRRIVYCTSEVLRSEARSGAFELHGAPGTPGELVFAGPAHARLDGEPADTVQAAGGHVLRYTHGIRPLTLEL